MTRLLASLIAVAAGLALPAAHAADAPVAKKKTVAKAAAKKAVAPAAAAAALAAEPETLSDGQLAVVPRVLTGTADCEFKQTVDVQPLADRPGTFAVKFGKQTYHMVPQETTTGAVRLHDRKQDVVWIQIPAKSMLLNHKVGQRLVDGCTHTEQRTTTAQSVEAVKVSAPADNAVLLVR